MDDEAVRGKIKALEKKYKSTEKAAEPHEDIGNERGRAGSTDQRMRRRRENLSATVPDGPLSSENDDRDDHDSRGHRSRVFAFFSTLSSALAMAPMPTGPEREP